MGRDPLRESAARALLKALEAYESHFAAMIAEDMASQFHWAASRSLDEVRGAASSNASDMLARVTELVIAHSRLSAKLWQRQMARHHAGSAPVPASDVDVLREEHRHALARLRDRCHAILSKG